MLIDIIILAICAVISGADGWEAIEQFGKTSIDRRHYICTLEDVNSFAHAARAHWGVENSLHWVLDVIFRENESRIRKGYAPENFNIFRQLGINLLKKEPSKMSIKKKRFEAALNDNFKENVVFLGLKFICGCPAQVPYASFNVVAIVTGRWVALLMLLLAGMPAQAVTNYVLADISSPERNLPTGCTGPDSSNQYTCGELGMLAGDTISLTTKPAILRFGGILTTGIGSTINAGGSASDLMLVLGGALNVGANAQLTSSPT
jgi:predicted transposase YbfD/YdcC